MCIDVGAPICGKLHYADIDTMIKEGPCEPHETNACEEEAHCPQGHVLREVKTVQPTFMFCRFCRRFAAVATTYGCGICDYSICIRCHPVNETAKFLRAVPDNIVVAISSSVSARESLQDLLLHRETAPPPRRAAANDLRALLDIDASHDLLVKRGAESFMCHRAILWARVPQWRGQIEELPDDLASLELQENAGFYKNLADEMRRLYTGCWGNPPGVSTVTASGIDALSRDLRGLLRAGDSAPGFVALISSVKSALTTHFASVGDDMPLGVADGTAHWIIQAICIDVLPMCKPFCKTRKCTEKNAEHHPDALVGVWQAAHHWGMDSVAALAEEALARHVNIRTCLVILGWAEDRGAAYVVRTAYRFLREHFEIIAASDPSVLERISTAHLIRLLGEDALQASHESVVLRAVLDWAVATPVHGDCPRVQERLHDFLLKIPRERAQILPELLRRVRLPLLEPGPSADYTHLLNARQRKAFLAGRCEDFCARSAQLHFDVEAKRRHIEEGRLLCLPRLTAENIATIELELTERQVASRRKAKREAEVAHI